MISKNLSAFLSMIAYSELGVMATMPATDRGYKVIVGSTPSHLNLMTGYSDHPRQAIEWKPGQRSTAAGRYQILARYFDAYKNLLGLTDFGPAAQDAIALQLIRECHATDLIETGQIPAAIAACKSRWASLPGAGYSGQNERQLPELLAAYRAAGGTLA